MEKLKLILKKALGESAVQVTLNEGKIGELNFGQFKSTPLNEFGVVDGLWLETLFKSLFPRDSLAIRAGDFVRGQLSIVNIGKVFLIADPRKPRGLYLFFPPSGELMSEQFFVRLKESIAAAAVGTPPPAPPPAAKMAHPSTRSTQKVPESALNPTDGATIVAPNQPMAEAYTPAFSKPESTSTMSRIFADSQPPPSDIMVNRKKLALIVSQTDAYVGPARAFIEEMQLFPVKVTDKSMFASIFDRYQPHFIFLDETATDHQEILKRLYDTEIEKRLNITVIVLSKTSNSKDTKSAFAQSVDILINQSELPNLKQVVSDAHEQRLSTIKAWSELKERT